MRDTVFLPESVMEDPEELRAWLRKALNYTATLPAKTKRASKNPAAKPRATTKTKGKTER